MTERLFKNKKWVDYLCFLAFTGLISCSVQAPDTTAPKPILIEPWRLPQSSIIIDAYAGNHIDWDAMATDTQVAAVIHKASEGLREDPKYKNRKKIALQRNYLWGSYHLGRPGDPIQQADFYLSVAQPGEQDFMALDLESVDPKKFMSIPDAIRFIHHIQAKTGRYPAVYGNHNVISTLSKQYDKTSVFAKTPLWYARFRKDIPNFPTQIWPSYTLWQFSSEINCQANATDCLRPVPGTAHDMDINVYPGSVKSLQQQWPFADGAIQD